LKIKFKIKKEIDYESTIVTLGNSVDAVYASHFATATHYFIYDTKTEEVEVMENTAPTEDPHAEADGAGGASLLTGFPAKEVVVSTMA